MKLEFDRTPGAYPNGELTEAAIELATGALADVNTRSRYVASAPWPDPASWAGDFGRQHRRDDVVDKLLIAATLLLAEAKRICEMEERPQRIVAAAIDMEKVVQRHEEGIKANTCPYCHGEYSLAAGGCANKCPISQSLARIVKRVAEFDENGGEPCNSGPDGFSGPEGNGHG